MQKKILEQICEMSVLQTLNAYEKGACRFVPETVRAQIEMYSSIAVLL